MEAPEACHRNPPAGAMAPFGFAEELASGITGEPLRFYTPYGLDDLLAPYAGWCSSNDILPPPASLDWICARLISMRSAESSCDNAQATRILNSVGVGISSHQQLIDIGRSIAPQNSQGLRTQIVFAGAKLASSAITCYTPYERLPMMLAAMPDAIGRMRGQTCPAVTAAIASAYAVMLHPFKEGNGRWSRLVGYLAANDVARIGTHSGILSILFQVVKKRSSIELWQQARQSGLYDFVCATLDFNRSFLARVTTTAEFRALDALWTLTQRAKGQPRTSLMQAFVKGDFMSIDEMRGCTGLSKRAFTGPLEEFMDSSKGGITTLGDRLDYSQCWNRLWHTVSKI